MPCLLFDTLDRVQDNTKLFHNVNQLSTHTASKKTTPLKTVILICVKPSKVPALLI
jgi:hypothetical protein